LVFQENSTDVTNKWCSPSVLKIRNGKIDYKWVVKHGVDEQYDFP